MKKDRRFFPGEDKLFSSAVFLLAEEQGAEELRKKEGAEMKPERRERRESEDPAAQPEFLKREWKRYRGSVRKRGILLTAGSAACIAVFLICGAASGLFGVSPDMSVSGSSAEESETFQEQILNHMFVYAGSQRYPFAAEDQIVLPDYQLKWERGSVVIEGPESSVIGIDNPDIVRLTYRTENGRLFSSLDTETKDSPREVSFRYYENYWEDLKWIGNPDEVFTVTGTEAPDFSLIEPDLLTICVVMKGGIRYDIEISVGYTPDGHIRAEIEGWEKGR